MKISLHHSIAPTVFLLSAAAAVFITVTGWVLYDHYIEAQRNQLLSAAQSTTRLIENIHSLRGGVESERLADTLFTQNATLFPPFGETGTYLLVMERKGSLRIASSRPDPQIAQTDLAEPARRALRGESGTELTLDYRGVKVVAAYAFAKEPGVALVAKIDLAEIRKPFIFRYVISLLPAAGLLLLSLVALIRRYRPFARQLAEQGESHRAILSSAPDAIITISESRRIQTFNLAAEGMFLYTAGEVLGKNVKLLMPEQFAREHDASVLNYLRTGQKKVIGIGREVVCRRKDGTEFYAHLSISEAIIEGQRFFTGILKDLSQIRELSKKIINVQEDERGRIAREIHDDLGTSLALLKLKIQSALEPVSAHQQSENDDRFKDIVKYLNEILAKTRGLAHELSPAGFKHLGFPEAIETLVAQIPTDKLRVQLDLEEMRDFFPENWDTNIYRIFQEAIANVIKHAQASLIDISARRAGNRLNIILRDNGKGADPAHLYQGGGLGMALMLQRARMAGGTALFKTEINQGLEVRLEIYK